VQLVTRLRDPTNLHTHGLHVSPEGNSNAKVLIAFDTFAGRTVYHCHILDHEDNGMMGVVDVR